jgi:hypothetical protein
MSDKTRKYLLYALGEILLVVIGILIALQINNWNEYRKNRIKEVGILEELLEDIKVNKQDLANDRNAEQTFVNNTKRVLEHFIQKRPTYDSLSHHIRLTSNSLQFSPRMVGYEELNAAGVDIIENEDLRQLIIRTFGHYTDLMVKQGREFEKFDNPTIDLTPHIVKYVAVDTSEIVRFKDEETGVELTTYKLGMRQYDELLNDKEVQVLLHKSLYNRINRMVQSHRLIARLVDLEQAINEELKTR